MLGESLMNRGRQIITFECHLLGHTVYNKITGRLLSNGETSTISSTAI